MLAGAGAEPTASSVVADLVEAARDLAHTARHRGFLPYRETGNLVPIEETTTAYYVRFDVTDRPGVIAEVARVLRELGFRRVTLDLEGFRSGSLNEGLPLVQLGRVE